MIEEVTHVRTEQAAKYLLQLCKHFAHKVEVTQSDTHGEIRFSCGTAVLDAEPQTLHIRARAADEDGLAETKAVVASHLLRFAFREKIEKLDWRTQG
jgi:uncharacterized protein